MNPVIARLLCALQIVLFAVAVVGFIALLHHLPDSSQLALQVDHHQESLQ